MEWFLALILFIAVFYQRDQMRSFRRRIDELEESLDHVLHLLRKRQESDPKNIVGPKPASITTRAQTVSSPVIARRTPTPADMQASEPKGQETGTAPITSEWPSEETGSGFSIDFEDIFGRKLPIWAGGVTLAVAGVLLVRYSIEAGLLTPIVRVILSFLFGISLLGGAEIAYRNAGRIGDARICQALAGAGLVTLYAGFYLAGTQYGLIGQSFAFIGLAIITGLSIALSYRFGLPAAVLGLVGGFAAPMLVGDGDANLPLLALYLALVTGGLTQTGNHQKRTWLGFAALIGGLGWGGLLLASGNFSWTDVLALGLYFVLLGAILPPMLENERFEQPLRLASAGIASLQLAALVDQGGYSALAWGLYLLLGTALAWLGWRKSEIRPANAIAAAIGIILLGIWPAPDPIGFGLVLAALTVLFAGIPLAFVVLKRDRLTDRLMLAAVPVFLSFSMLTNFSTFGLYYEIFRPWEAIACFALATLPLMGSRFLWSREGSVALAANLASGGLLAAFAAMCLLPNIATPFILGALACALIWLLRARVADQFPLAIVVWLFAVSAMVSLSGTSSGSHEITAISEGLSHIDPVGLLRWLAAFVPLAGVAWIERQAFRRGIAEFLAALILFGALAQVLPPIALAWVTSAIVIALRWKAPERDMAMAAFIIALASWAAIPIAIWLEGGITALAGRPFLLGGLPNMRETLGFILPLTIALSATKMSARGGYLDRAVPLFWAAFPVGFIVLHVLYKQIFAIETVADFEQAAFAERIVFETLLLVLGWSIFTDFARYTLSRQIAVVIAGLGLAHFVCFTLFWHNPLWVMQAVGPVPIANLVLAAYAVGIALLLSIRMWQAALRPYIDAAVMLFATLGALTLLRHIFSGTYLPDNPMTQAEDLLRSLVSILLAVAFLLIGSHRGERVWRVGSLVLMTGTAIKVFIFDTAGLEGLVRIVSFVALGASLIGIGWFYSRQLRTTSEQ